MGGIFVSLRLNYFLNLFDFFFNCLFVPEGKTHFHNLTFCTAIYYTVWLFYGFWGREPLLHESRNTENDKKHSKSISFMDTSMIFFLYLLVYCIQTLL